MGSRRKHYISKEDYKIILADMQEEYPGLFLTKEVKLFKVGIIKELLLRSIKVGVKSSISNSIFFKEISNLKFIKLNFAQIRPYINF